MADVAARRGSGGRTRGARPRRGARCGRCPRTSACAGRGHGRGCPAGGPPRASGRRRRARRCRRDARAISRPWPPAMPVMRTFSPGCAPGRGGAGGRMTATFSPAGPRRGSRRSGLSVELRTIWSIVPGADGYHPSPSRSGLCRGARRGSSHVRTGPRLTAPGTPSGRGPPPAPLPRAGVAAAPRRRSAA